MVRQHAVNDIEELFATLRLSNSALFGDDIVSPWVFRGQPDASQRLLPKLWRENFLDDPRFTARGSLFFRMVEESIRKHQIIATLGEEHVRRIDACKRLIIEHALMRNIYTLQSEVLHAARVRIPGSSELVENGCEKLLAFDGDYWRAMPLAQHYNIPTRLLDLDF